MLSINQPFLWQSPAFLQEKGQDRVKDLQGITLNKPAELAPAIPVERDIVPGSKTDAITRPILEGEAGSHIGAFFDLDRTLIQGFSAKQFFQTRLMSGRMTSKEIVAQFAGVLPGDIIIAVNQSDVKNFDNIKEALKYTKVGDVLKLTVIRDDKTKTISVKLRRKA